MIACARAPLGIAAAARLHDLPEQRVIGVATAVVSDSRPDASRERRRDCAIKSSMGLALELGMIFECVVEIGDVSLVVFRVMDLHRLGVDVGLEAPKSYGRGGKVYSAMVSSSKVRV